MAEFPGFTLWTDAYLADTGDLTTIQHGAYLLLPIVMWRASGYLPNDDARLARFARLGPRQWEAVKPTIWHFFTVLPDGRLTQKRLQTELERARGRSMKAAQGGVAKHLKSIGVIPDQAEPEQRSKPATISTDTDIDKTTENLPQTNITDRTSSSVGSRSEKPNAERGVKGTRLDPAWVLPKAWGDWALANSSLTADEVRIEAETFRDYWCSKAGRDATKADWLATWRNWIRRRNAEGPRARGSPSKFGKQESPMERRKRELAERIENEHGIGRERGGNPADVGLLPRRRPDD